MVFDDEWGRGGLDRRCGAHAGGTGVERWKLSLVQRDRAWDEHWVACLLDLLLEGYPIGTLLLYRTRERSATLEIGRPKPRASADDESWQILDGQQRVLALSSVFAGEPEANDDGVARRFLRRC